jgi:predicted nucleic acid-binding protein
LNLWLLDASVLLASEDPDDEHHHDSRRLLVGGDPLATLDLAFYEVTNVAVRSWRDQPSARRLRSRVTAVADDAGLVRVDVHLLEDAAAIADEHDISVYDAAYVAAARAVSGRLVSCDVRDLVSRGLAVLPHLAVGQSAETEAEPPGHTSP